LLTEQTGKQLRFTSTLHQTTAQEIQGSSAFTEDFFRSQDALEPGITCAYFFRAEPGQASDWQPGDRRQVRNLGLPLYLRDGMTALTKHRSSAWIC
jgi:hypothetical protein